MSRADEFHEAMLHGCDRTAEFGYYPNYFRQAVANNGGVLTVKSLLAKRTLTPGFLRLYQAGRLDLSCEAFVIAPYYAELFQPDEIAWATHQLREVDFDVDAYLARIGERAP